MTTTAIATTTVTLVIVHCREWRLHRQVTLPPAVAIAVIAAAAAAVGRATMTRIQVRFPQQHRSSLLVRKQPAHRSP